jgi:hypothetical protein
MRRGLQGAVGGGDGVRGWDSPRVERGAAASGAHPLPDLNALKELGILLVRVMLLVANAPAGPWKRQEAALLR